MQHGQRTRVWGLSPSSSPERGGTVEIAISLLPLKSSSLGETAWPCWVMVDKDTCICSSCRHLGNNLGGVLGIAWAFGKYSFSVLLGFCMITVSTRGNTHTLLSPETGEAEIQVVPVQSLSHVWLFVTPWAAGLPVPHYLLEFAQVLINGHGPQTCSQIAVDTSFLLSYS